MKQFHDALKTIYGPKCSGVITVLTDKQTSFESRTEHINSVLNRPASSIKEDAIDILRHIECSFLLDGFQMVRETKKKKKKKKKTKKKKKVQQLSSGKAPCADFCRSL